MKRALSFVLGVVLSVSLMGTFFPCSVGGAEKVTLRFWATADPKRDRGRRVIWQNFEKRNPGTKVEFEGIPWGQFTEKILTAAAAGTLPDAIRYGYVGRFASRGVLLPLEEFIKGPDGIDTDKYFEGLYPNPSIMWDGKVYGLPWLWEGAPAAFYNNDILEKEGITPPETWSELETALEKLTRKTPGGEVKRYGMILYVSDYIIDGFVGTNGGRLTDVWGHEATKATYSAPENLEGYRFLANMAKKDYIRPMTKSEMMVKDFVDGKAAMCYSYGSGAYAWRPEVFPDFDWGVTRCPVPKGKPKVAAAQFGDAGFIFKTTKHRELAWKLLKAYVWKEGSPLIHIHKFGGMPPFKDILDPETLNPAYYPFQVERHLRAIAETALGLPSKMVGPSRWHLRGKEIEEIEEGQYDLMFRGIKSPEEVAEYLDRKIGAMLPEKK